MKFVFGDQRTPTCKLPPWEIAKAFASHKMLIAAAATAGQSPTSMVGQRLHDFIASKVHLKGGGHPNPQTILKLIRRCKDPA